MINFEEKCRISDKISQELVRKVTPDTVLGHWARYGNQFDEYFQTGKTREEKVIQGEISFTEYVGGVEG